MNALILAAGYATRLRPLTEVTPKPLLRLAGRPMLDYLIDKLAVIQSLSSVHLVTNHRFAAQFADWANTSAMPVTIHDDDTSTNEARLGALGDAQLVISRAKLAGAPLLMLAADNLFDFSLADFIAFWRSKKDGSAIALYRCPDPTLVRQYSTVTIDDQARLTSFIEKPANPTTDLVGIATYLYHPAHVALLRRYLDEGNPKDQPGNFIAWLRQREPVYGYQFQGDWLDIGDLSQLLAADNQRRARVGLLPRAHYEG